MLGLPLIDVIVIICYFISIIFIGFWAMTRVKSKEDFFLGGRRFGKAIQIFASFGQATSVSTTVSATTTTMENGASGIWSTLLYLFGTPTYWITCLWYRRLRLMTMGDFFVDRYGSKKMGGLFSLVSAIGFMIIISTGFNALGKTVLVLMPRGVDKLTVEERVEYDQAVELNKLEAANYATLTPVERTRLNELRLADPQDVFPYLSKTTLIIIVCAITLIYSSAGGLEAAFVTDLIQGSFIIILSILLLPFVWAKINLLYGGGGGPNFFKAMRILHENLPESYFQIMGTPKSIDFTWYYIAGLTLMVTLNLGVQANQLTTSGSAKDEYTARFGFVTGVYMKRACTILWGMFALAAIILYKDKVRDPDLVYGYATLDLLGSLNLGLVGLMIACMMAALMASASCLMICSSGLLTHNLFQPLFPNLKEKHYVVVGRVMGSLVIVGGAWIAINFESVFQQLKLSWEIPAVFAACFWFGMLWRRSNRKGAWTSIVVTLLLFFVLPVFMPILMPSLKTDPYLVKRTDPAPIEREYTAKQMDVKEREEDIAKWDELNVKGEAMGTRPNPIEVGKKFTKIYKLPPKSIFWTQTVKLNKQGVLEGYGMLNIELIAIDKMFDLSKMPYAFNETLRLLFRVIVPFGVLFVVAMFTKPDEKHMLDRFFVKMKTKVTPGRDADRKELEVSYANPDRFNHMKVFPNSSWELTKWNKEDTIGFLISIVVALLIFGALFVLVNVGG